MKFGLEETNNKIDFCIGTKQTKQLLIKQHLNTKYIFVYEQVLVQLLSKLFKMRFLMLARMHVRLD